MDPDDIDAHIRAALQPLEARVAQLEAALAAATSASQPDQNEAANSTHEGTAYPQLLLALDVADLMRRHSQHGCHSVHEYVLSLALLVQTLCNL